MIAGIKEETISKKAVPQVRWDDSRLKSTYANVCNVSSAREEVTLIFGTNQTLQYRPPSQFTRVSATCTGNNKAAANNGNGSCRSCFDTLTFKVDQLTGAGQSPTLRPT